jgi:hypothetical protein
VQEDDRGVELECRGRSGRGYRPPPRLPDGGGVLDFPGPDAGAPLEHFQEPAVDSLGVPSSTTIGHSPSQCLA